MILTQHRNSVVVVLLERGIARHGTQRKTGVDRKSARKIAQSMANGPSNPSTSATGYSPVRL
jgi:hypothetical protein